MILTQSRSNREVDDAFVLVALDEIVDKVGIKDSLEEPGHERQHHEVMPFVNPELGQRYQ